MRDHYKRKLYKELASTIDARIRCGQLVAKLNPNAVSADMNNNEWHQRKEWFDKHTDTIARIVSDFLPSGSGWDGGTKIDLDNSTGEKIILYGSFHHMDENGFYAGWTEHTITVRPSLIHEISLSISGRNRNEIKEYLYDIFSSDLTQTIDWDDESKHWKRAETKGGQ